MPPNLRYAEPDLVLGPDKMNNEQEGNKRSVATGNLSMGHCYLRPCTTR